MKRAIDLYKNYGFYTNTEKMLPSIIDGLLPVHRRMLYVLHKIAATTKSKTATVLGEMIGKYHPHSLDVGPAAWAVHNEFAIGDGSWGSNIGIEVIDPANPRYTSIKASPFVEKNIMRFVNYSKIITNDLGFNEPVNLSTPFPFCLMSQRQLSTLGFGIKTDFPIYTKKDLLKRLLFLIKQYDKDIIIKPVIKGCDILSSNKELKNILTTGKASIKVRGKYTEDPKNGIVYIYGWAPGRRFADDTKKTGASTGVYKKILKIISEDKEFGHIVETGGIGFIDESTSASGTKIRFQILKQKNVQQLYELMKKAIDLALTSNVRYAMFVCDDSDEKNIHFKLSSVDEMLLNCYNNYKNVYKNYCEVNIEKYKEQIKELELIKLIKPHISTMKLKKDLESNLQTIADICSVPVSDIKNVVEKYSIKKLLTYNDDTNTVKEKLNEMNNKLNNLETSVLIEYKNLLENTNE